jgi:hypothetical protein
MEFIFGCDCSNLIVLTLVCKVMLAQWSSINEPERSVFETL